MIKELRQGFQSQNAYRESARKLEEQFKNDSYQKASDSFKQITNKAMRTPGASEEVGNDLIFSIGGFAQTVAPEAYKAAGNKVDTSVLNNGAFKDAMHNIQFVQWGTGNFAFYDSAELSGQKDDAGNDIYNIRIAEFKPGDKKAPGPKLAFKNLVNADQDGDGVIQMTVPELDILMQDYQHHVYSTVSPVAYNASRRFGDNGTFEEIPKAEQDQIGDTGYGSPSYNGAYLSDETTTTEIFNEINGILKNTNRIAKPIQMDPTQVTDTLDQFLEMNDDQIAAWAVNNGLRPEDIQFAVNQYSTFASKVKDKETEFLQREQAGETISNQDKAELRNLKRRRDRYITGQNTLGSGYDEELKSGTKSLRVGPTTTGTLQGTLYNLNIRNKKELSEAEKKISGGMYDRDTDLEKLRAEKQKFMNLLSVAPVGTDRANDLTKKLEDKQVEIDNRIEKLRLDAGAQDKFKEADIAGILGNFNRKDGGIPFVTLPDQISNLLKKKGYQVSDSTKQEIDNYINSNFNPETGQVILEGNKTPKTKRDYEATVSRNIRDSLAMLYSFDDSVLQSIGPDGIDTLMTAVRVTGTLDTGLLKEIRENKAKTDKVYNRSFSEAGIALEGLYRKGLQLGGYGEANTFTPDTFMQDFTTFYQQEYDNNAKVSEFLARDREKYGGQLSSFGQLINAKKLETLAVGLRPILENANNQRWSQWAFSFGNDDVSAGTDLLTGKYRIQAMYSGESKFLKYSDLYDEKGGRKGGPPGLTGFRMLGPDGGVAGAEELTLDDLRESIDDLGGDPSRDLKTLIKIFEDVAFYTGSAG
jgi:hypothetical protein